MNGISLHIGLNKVDANYYGSAYNLSGCHNDAQDMAAICKNRGYSSSLLLDEDANATRVVDFLQATANQLNPGDSFILTYAGHGTQVPDKNSDEPDKSDECWVLFDRLLIDDEIYQALSNFKAGVRVFLISDSCHSGTISRQMEYKNLVNLKSRGLDSGVFRTPDVPDFGLLITKKYPEQYTSIYHNISSNARDLMMASVIQLSACQDDQLSADGIGNGLFTSKLKEVWDNGSFDGSYPDFCKAITNLLPAYETPNFLTMGSATSSFEKEKPFTINSNNNLNLNPMKTENSMQADMKTESKSRSVNPIAQTTDTQNDDRDLNGNWIEVKAELEHKFPSFNFPTSQKDITDDFLKRQLLSCTNSFELLKKLNFNEVPSYLKRAATGAPIVRTFFWGFHIEVSSEGLSDFINTADPINTIIGSIGPVAGPAGPYIVIAAAFIAGALKTLKNMDQGKGIYISMSWFALGVFIPTTVTGRQLPPITRGPGDAYEQAGLTEYRNYAGGLFGSKIDEDVLWNLPDGTIRENVIVNLNPPKFGNVYTSWLSEDPTVGHFRVHAGVSSCQGGTANFRMMIKDAPGRRGK